MLKVEIGIDIFVPHLPVAQHPRVDIVQVEFMSNPLSAFEGFRTRRRIMALELAL